MIIITGAAGFIGSCLIARLNEEGYNDLVLVDDFSSDVKNKNLEGKLYTSKINRKDFFIWLQHNHKLVQFIFHLGARTDTAEFNTEVLNELNLEYSKKIWNSCISYGLPLVYASSAATYGAGEQGYSDAHGNTGNLHPLNPYGVSKNEFDKWAIKEETKPYYWIGLKFFNVYGPNEYHKGRMASVIFHAFNQIIETGEVKLFRSHKSEYSDGGQRRDFIYVKDICDILFFLMHNRVKSNSGLYNAGTGKAETFLDLAKLTFEALGKDPIINFIDIPDDIRDKYQYFTEAEMGKLRSAGYNKEFTSLKDGVLDYVGKYLKNRNYY
jgi:ADP-L-glycero-D-manno-heptose 6-epimerase